MWFWIPLIAVFVVDRATKYYATHGLMQRPFGRMEVIPGLLDFFLQHNTGGAFSLGADYPMVVTGFSILVIAMFFVWAWRLPKAAITARVATGLILGGAVGNLYDRISFQYVIDFIHFHRGTWYFATFNVADAAICIGIGWFLILAIFTKQLDEKLGVKPATDSADKISPDAENPSAEPDPPSPTPSA